jgi:FkbM family methyltransferase
MNKNLDDEVFLALCNWIKPGDTVLDVGANVGSFTNHMAKLVGPGGHVHAFEPEPNNFSALEKAVSNRKLHNVSLHRSALGAMPGFAKLYLSQFNVGMHRLYKSEVCGEGSILTEVQTIDNLFKPDEISLIKIDIEGFEPYALFGAESLIKQSKITVVAEHCPPSILEAGASITKYLSWLRYHQFRVFNCTSEEVDWESLISDGQRWDSFGCERLKRRCKGKTNPQIAEEVQAIGYELSCRRPYIENLVFIR